LSLKKEIKTLKKITKETSVTLTTKQLVLIAKYANEGNVKNATNYEPCN
jgi:hypothetical protein